LADHPVKVPQDLAERLWFESADKQPQCVTFRAHVFAQKIADWAADQELEACCETFNRAAWAHLAVDLRAARRPKPPSLAELGCNALDAYIYGNPDHGDKQNTYNTIRTALNRLAELEAQQ
jgi:hypothetical protein